MELAMTWISFSSFPYQQPHCKRRINYKEIQKQNIDRFCIQPGDQL